MKIGIHKSQGSFSDRWITYCEEKRISWKQVDCYSNDIISQLNDCDALMWHINQGNPTDNLIAKQIIYSIEATGKKVFPDFNTSWHFDDKVGQKYLLEAISAPLAPTWVFYDKTKAILWIDKVSFPKIFKLRCGAGSQNVILVHSKQHAIRLVNRAFVRGFSQYNALGSLKERWRTLKLGKTNITDMLKGLIRLVIPPPYARFKGREKGYIYFQEFIPDNTFDIRIIIIGDKAFAIKRMVRKGDFRASGSGNILYDKEHFNEETVRLSFHMAEKLKSQCAAFDFVFLNAKIYLVEISFGFVKEVYDPCTGFWDKNLTWHEGNFNPYGWMVENLIKSVSVDNPSLSN